MLENLAKSLVCLVLGACSYQGNPQGTIGPYIPPEAPDMLPVDEYRNLPLEPPTAV